LPSIFLAPLVFAAGSVAAYVVFWATFLDPLAGRFVWAAIVALNAAWLVVAWRRRPHGLPFDRDAWVPFALTGLVTVACLAYLAWAGVSPPRRFTLELPVADHLAPQLLADRFARGIRDEPRPLAPLTTFALTTQTSDRPALQAAVALMASPAWPVSPATHDFAYQAVGTLCQVSVLSALLALSAAIGLTRREEAFVLVAVTCSGFFLVNAVYPWPKLYAAALLLTSVAILVHVARRGGAASDAQAASLGGLAALALLAHGSPVFSLLAAPTALAMPSVRKLITRRHIVWALLASVSLLAPWMAYQRYVDPPGTRLVKIHLAGELTPDDRTLATTLVDAYRTVDAGTWLKGRLDNLRVQTYLTWSGLDPIYDIQHTQFFGLLSTLGVLPLGFLAVVTRARKSDSVMRMNALLGYAGAAWLIWIIVMFRGGTASVHHGSYATTLLFMMSGAIGLASWGRAGVALMTLQVVSFAGAWLLPRAGVPVLSWSLPAAIVLVAAVATSVWLCRAWFRHTADVEVE
jgi:hypothetical protein